MEKSRMNHPDSISPTTLRPNSQTCNRCGAVDYINFHVPNDIWAKVAGEEWTNDYYDSVLCLACFDDLALEKNINYAQHITNIYFAGNQASFEFQPIYRLDKKDFKG